MPETISIVCSCGKKLRAAPQHVGKKIRCPACQAAVAVFAPAEEAAEIAEVADEMEEVNLESLVACPECSKEWPGGTVVCVACGYNFKTGKSLKTRIKFKEQKLVLGSKFLGSYTRFSITRDSNGHKRFTRQNYLFWMKTSNRTVDLDGYDSIVTDHETNKGWLSEKSSWAGDSVYLSNYLGFRRSYYGEIYLLELEGPGKRPFDAWGGYSEADFRQLCGLFTSVGFAVRRK